MSLQRLDVLQSMVNAILLETGRALRASNKGTGKANPSSSNSRLRTSIPGAIDNFHQALDDLEADIVRAKAVMHRDLEELRAKRFAAENPPIPEVIPTIVEEESPKPSEEAVEIQQESQTIVKQENIAPEAPMIPQDAPEELISTGTAEQGPRATSPPSSHEIKQEPASLSLKTEISAPAVVSPTATGGLPDSAIDSLFGTTESLDILGDSDLNFDTMDFLDSSNAHDSQTQNTEFDLSTFGNNTSDFNMTDLQVPNEVVSNNNNSATTNQDDLFGLAAGDADLMDLDTSMRPREESSFDDLFFLGEDNGIGGGGGSNEMEHGAFDEDFFNLN